MNIYFVSDSHGSENAVLDINGKKYRVRAEILVLDNNNNVYIANSNKMNQYGRTYKIPGGSISSENNIIDTAINESKEECRFIVKNVIYSDIKYVSEYKFTPEWHKRILWPLGLKYSGSITFICVGRFDGYYNGYIDPYHTEEEMTKGLFVDYNKSNLSKFHRKAIDKYLSMEKI